MALSDTSTPCFLVSNPLAAHYTRSLWWDDGRHRRWESVHCGPLLLLLLLTRLLWHRLLHQLQSLWGLVSSPCSCCSFALAVLLLYCLLCLSVLFLACACLCISPVLVSALASPLFSMCPPLASPFCILLCVSSSGFYLPFLSILLQRHQGLLWFHFGTLWVC